MAEKASWDQAKRRQKLGLVWRNRKKINQIINDYIYLSFFFLIFFMMRTKGKEAKRVRFFCWSTRIEAKSFFMGNRIVKKIMSAPTSFKILQQTAKRGTN